MDLKKGTVFFIISFLLIGLISMPSTGLGLILLGLWILFYALWVSRTLRYIHSNGMEAKAAIIHHEKNGDGFLISLYEFITHEGVIIQGHGLGIGYIGEKGETVDILYNPKHPHDFIIKNNLTFNKYSPFIRIFVLAIVVFCLIVGCFLF